MEFSVSRFIDARYRVVFWPIVGSFMVFGLSLIVIGALLPRILVDLHWSYTAAGVVIAANSIGYFCSTLASGLLVHRFGHKVVLTTGLTLMAVSLFFFGSLPSVVFNVALNFVIGVGQGTIEIVANSSIVRMERRGESHLMSFLHSSFSVAAIAGPAVIAYIVARELPWQAVYRVIALLTLAVGLSMTVLPFERLRDGEETAGEGGARATLRTLLRYPMLSLAFAALFLYVGIEIGLSNWVSEYFVRVFGAPAATGAFMVSVFWIGILTGRVLLPVVYRGPKLAEFLVLFAALCAVSLAVMLLMPTAVAAGIFVFLTSVGCSIYYPRVMTLLGSYFPNAQSVAVGFSATGGGIGMFLFPLAMSAVAQAFGLRAGFALYVVMAAFLTGVSTFIVREFRHRVAS